jgi:Rieske Fe-S protein
MKIEDAENISQAPDGREQEHQPRWRQDFPIDWPQDEYRSRREFTRLLLLTSLSFVAGQAWIVFLSYSRRFRGRLPLQEVAEVSEMDVGKTKMFHYPGKNDPCLLVRAETGEFVAYSQRCTHLSCPVIPKLEDKTFHCPCHEGSFDLFSGQPLAGPPRRALARIQLQVRNGRIYATGMEGA